MKSAHSCRVCARWLEGEWSRADSDEARAQIQALMDRGYCDKPGCVSEAERRLCACPVPADTVTRKPHHHATKCPLYDPWWDSPSGAAAAEVAR